MADGIKVDYSTLNECIEGLKTITVQVGGDEITKLIASLDNVFSETNSDTANKLHSVKEKYNTVNNALVEIARNGIDVLELAMKAYEDADANMQAQIDASSATGSSDESGYVTGGGGVTSPKGLIGRDFEDYLTKTIGGNGSFSVEGREFDGGVGNRWWEAKSGQYWELLEGNPNKLVKFKSDMGDRLRIAMENGATYELFSNTPIPDSIKQWLDKKRIKYTELLD